MNLGATWYGVQAGGEVSPPTVEVLRDEGLRVL